MAPRRRAEKQPGRLRKGLIGPDFGLVLFRRVSRSVRPGACTPFSRSGSFLPPFHWAVIEYDTVIEGNPASSRSCGGSAREKVGPNEAADSTPPGWLLDAAFPWNPELITGQPRVFFLER
ncbi:hypothetical protein THTE_0867 [Thermogutta terrifontis]|uniref:Uncharacterized protein n=1 Tax=Thermogutta terrifontis TaxID=1331910 RepID=A0A286RBX5_9BACT|nr:hypothetical protein THTE_0867 [Thermogutta terrifontis]